MVVVILLRLLIPKLRGVVHTDSIVQFPIFLQNVFPTDRIPRLYVLKRVLYRVLCLVVYVAACGIVFSLNYRVFGVAVCASVQIRYNYIRRLAT